MTTRNGLVSRRLLALLAALTMLFAVFAAGSASAEEDGGYYTLTVLHNNDGESQLVNAGSGIEDFGGVARFATQVRANRQDAARSGNGSVLLSSGDNFLAGPELAAGVANGIPFYDTTALDYLRYDAISFGNHDFDFGPDFLADFLSGYRKPPAYVNVNLDFSEEPNLQAFVAAGVIKPATLVTTAGERIGIVGAVTPDLTFISSPRDTIINSNIAELVQAQVDRMEARGIDKIIFISHLQDVDEDVALAAELTGVDVMIAGGGDEVLANDDDLLVPGDEIFGPYPVLATGADGATIPVVTTAGDYKYLGRLDVTFDHHGNAIGWDGGPIRIAGGDNPDAVGSNSILQRLVVEPVEDFLEALASNVIATSEVALEGRRDPGIRTEETNLGNLMADSLLYQANLLAADFGVPEADVALQNGGGIRNNTEIPPGDITELNTFEIAPFANFVTIIPDIPREQFKLILENAYRDAPESNGRFAQVSGFTVEYDPNGTPSEIDPDTGDIIVEGSKVVNVTLDDGTEIVVGGVVQAGDDIVVATIDFLARGGDQYPFMDAPFTSVGASYQQALFDYIVDGLGGLISAADYPEGGEGRIVELP
ncbi:MAG TPA: bifunctional metallophosphatase/5'-nucleotidase [Acidimicrobiia bacterium]|nr:bifunctional metallophosphatase/5'-nucleotidase [Acidimicrobiia bacterium]